PGVEPDVADVQLAGGPDVDLAQAGPGGRGQAAGARQGALAGPEAGHGDGQDAVAGEAQQVEGADANEQGEGRVEAARETEEHAPEAGVLEAPGEPRGLDREDLVAALVEGGGVARDDGMRVDP